jgi:hypothetical protein
MPNVSVHRDRQWSRLTMLLNKMASVLPSCISIWRWVSLIRCFFNAWAPCTARSEEDLYVREFFKELRQHGRNDILRDSGAIFLLPLRTV